MIFGTTKVSESYVMAHSEVLCVHFIFDLHRHSSGDPVYIEQLGAELPFYHVIDRLSDSTFTVYPFLGEVFDQKTRNKYDGKVYYDGSDRFPWGRIEDLVSQVSRQMVHHKSY